MLSIDIYSDVFCPWCWIGKRRLEKGLALAGLTATVRSHPFELNPDMPTARVERREWRPSFEEFAPPKVERRFGQLPPPTKLADVQPAGMPVGEKGSPVPLAGGITWKLRHRPTLGEGKPRE